MESYWRVTVELVELRLQAHASSTRLDIVPHISTES